MSILDTFECIKKDLERTGSFDRYPIRFFNIKLDVDISNSLMRLRQMLSNLYNNTIEIIDVKNFLPDKEDHDGWISADGFRKKVEKLDDKKTYIIVGFSEYARFLSNKEFITLILGLLELENQNQFIKRRIYFPCFALYNQIKKVVGKYHVRLKDYDPFLNNIEVEELPKIFFINDDLDNVGYNNEIVNSEEWFSIWKNSYIDISKPIISTSKILSYFYDLASPANIYDIKKVTTHEQLFFDLYGIKELVLPNKEIRDDFFRKLHKLLRTYPNANLSFIILQEINAQKITSDNIYSLWKVASKFNRWLIQNYILIFNTSDKYLNLVMDGMENLTDKAFIERVFLCIFKKKSDSLCLERRNLINSITKINSQIHLTARIISYYEDLLLSIFKKHSINLKEIDMTKNIEIPSENITSIIEEVKERLLSIITDSSIYERHIIIWGIRVGIINVKEIKNIYPHIWDYLNCYGLNLFDNDLHKSISNYFDIYRKCRLCMATEDQYNDALISWNSNEESFYEWYNDNHLEHPESILKKQNYNGVVYVLDGVGAEFLEYIFKLLEHSGYIVDYVSYAKSHLPSITSLAKEFYKFPNQWPRVYDEEVVHGKIYYHVENIEMALTILEDLIKQIIEDSEEEQFAIIADHGATVGHKLFKREKKYNFVDADHDGRCCLIKKSQEVSPSTDYIVHTDELSQQWIISLNEQSLYNNSKYAVHGGATLEEVLVPVIIAHKSTKNTKLYKVIPKDIKVSGLKREIQFVITPKPEAVNLTANDGTNIFMRFDSSKNIWVGELRRGIMQEIRLNFDNQQFSFKTEASNKMGGIGADGFDD